MSAFEHKKFFEEHVEDGATFPKMSEMQKYAMRYKVYQKYKRMIFMSLYIFICIFMSLVSLCL